jgi:hypothetical protein
MVTNDVRLLAAPGAGPVYAALVSPKGKLLHDLFVWRGDSGDAGDAGDAGGAGAAGSTAPGGRQQGAAGAAGSAGAAPAGAAAQQLLLEVDAAGAPAVLSWLARYKLRRPIRLEDAGGELQVWARWPGGGGGGGGGDGASSSGGGGDSGGWAPDPRLPDRQLGERGVFVAAAAPGGSGGGEAAHRLLRYSLGVPEGDGEMPAGGRAGRRGDGWMAPGS